MGDEVFIRMVVTEEGSPRPSPAAAREQPPSPSAASKPSSYPSLTINKPAASGAVPDASGGLGTADLTPPTRESPASGLSGADDLHQAARKSFDNLTVNYADTSLRDAVKVTREQVAKVVEDDAHHLYRLVGHATGIDGGIVATLRDAFTKNRDGAKKEIWEQFGIGADDWNLGGKRPYGSMSNVKTHEELLPVSPAKPGGGMLAGLSTGGAVGIAVAGGLLADYFIGKVSEKTQSMIAHVDRAGQSLAGNDAVSLFKEYAAATADMMETVPIVGTALGGLARSASGAVSAVDNLAKAFVSRAHEIVYVSGDIAAAESRQSVRQIMMDLREAQQLGKGYANLSDTQGRLQAQVQDILLPWKDRFIKVTDQILMTLESILTVVKPLSTVVGGASDVGSAIGDHLRDMIPWLKLIKKLVELNDESNKKQDLERMKGATTELWDRFKAMNMGRAGPLQDGVKEAARRAAGQRLNIPAFNR